jgi:Tol biopolymer transport system component
MGGITGATYDIYSARLDGTGVRRETSGNYYSVALSPQAIAGATLYFVATSVHADEGVLMSLSLKTKALQPKIGVKALAVSVSPDGSKLLLESPPGYYSLSLLDLASGSQRAGENPGDSYISQALFSPSGESVLILEDKNRDGHFSILRKSVRGGTESTVFQF